MAIETEDDLSAFEARDTAHHIPVGWALLFGGLIAWGLYYLWAYTPGLGGWQQAQDAEGGASVGSNLLFTVLFTAIPAAVAVALILVQRRKKVH
jgi:hypothetical protein